MKVPYKHVCACAVAIQDQLMELDCVLPLKALMKSSSPEPPLSLLSVLSAHPPNNVRPNCSSQDVNRGEYKWIWPSFNSQFILVSEGILEEIASFLHHNRSSSVIVTHCCEIMASLCSSSIGQQVQRSSSASFNARLCVQLMLDLCIYDTQDRQRLEQS